MKTIEKVTTGFHFLYKRTSGATVVREKMTTIYRASYKAPWYLVTPDLSAQTCYSRWRIEDHTVLAFLGPL